MKKTLLYFFLLLTTLGAVKAQNAVHVYNLRGDFNEATNAGPALIPIGPGRFVNDTLTDFNGMQRPVYQFDRNSGFYLNDSLQQFLASGSYTIELYFKMAELSSWKRVIDFKNRTSDRGCYVFSGQLNFYNIATSQGAPFAVNEYSQYVISRDAASKRVRLYGDGNKYITFTDNNNDAVYDSSAKRLNFFQDDLAVPNEASAGAIAMLRIYNYELDSQIIKTNYDGLNQSLTVAQVAAGATGVQIHPNPATDILHIRFPENGRKRLQILALTGQVLLDQTTTEAGMDYDVKSLIPGMYCLTITNESGHRSVSRFYKQ